jgi:nitrogen fixation NifU-like protein
MSLYQEIILDHYRNPRNSKLLADATNSIELDNPLCGDTITLSIKEENNIVVDVGYEAKGCAISVASASLLSEYVIGKSKDELKKLDKDFIIELIGIELSLNRIKCALLPLEALSKVI